MEDKKQSLLKKGELKKSLVELDFSEEEIASIIEKAEKDGKLEEVSDDKVVDKPDDYDGDDMKKSYDKVMSAKAEFDKSMSEFLDKFGKVPGFEKPTNSVDKSVNEDINKSMINDFEKSFGDKFGLIEKSLTDFFSNQGEINEKLSKSLDKLSEDVQAIAEAPNPLKGIFGSYKNSVIEKGIKTDEDGKAVYSLKDKPAVIDSFEKSLDKIENEKDKQVVRDMISSYTISGKVSETGLNIVKKALDIDFEK